MKKLHAKTGKSLLLVVSLALMVTVTVGGTLAFLLDVSGPLANIFKPSVITTTVVEEFEGGVKTNVKIQNTGDTTAWIRAAVVITWQDADGNIYGTPPVAGTDYTITYSRTNWLTGDDGFYYYTKPVKSQEEDGTNCFTGVLISECKPTIPSTAPDGYKLCVEIICSGLQYKPASVFDSNWAASSGLAVTGTPGEDGYGLAKGGT